uniref:DUF4187 domain-containing protein n=1 Tax=Panagrellus redivivus TaxID=6233 RepID=A0A7E4VCQ4_PANRE
MTPPLASSTPPPQPEASAAQKPKKKKRRKRKNKFEDEDYEESRGIVKKLMQRYAKKEKSEEENVTNAMMRDGKIIHPTKYVKQIERGIRGQWSRLCALPETPEGLTQCRYICALCQLPACIGDMNDLFGPYFIETDPSLPTPTFLFPPGVAPDTSRPQKIDIFLHDQCALWSHELFFYGGKFPKLTEKLYEYWSQKCHFCHKKGASIEFDSTKMAHYPCLSDKNYEFNPEFFTISPPMVKDYPMLPI